MMDRRELLKSSLLTCGAAAASNTLGSWFPHAVLADNTSIAPIVETNLGKVRGAFQNGVYSFKGIHYDASTEGPMRFLPPSPPKPWTGVRDALEVGPPAPQDRETPALIKERELQLDPIGPEQMSEDCLVLNVWAPSLHGPNKRPVMVWLHGGGYDSNSSGIPLYDGTRLAAKHDVVLVGLNHRLNVFGYLYLGRLGGEKYANSGNVGMLDVVLALRWLRDNIAQFGGDPGNVTLFGQSGGGWKISTLMAMPSAEGLFHKAILESGSQLRARSLEEADSTAQKFLAQLQVKPDQVDDLQRMSMGQLISTLHSMSPPFNLGPVVDGHSLTRHPFDHDAPASSADVSMLIGTNTDESRVSTLFNPALFSMSESDMRTRLKASLSKAGLDDSKLESLIAIYHKNRPNASPSDIFFAVNSDRIRINAIIQAERKEAQRAAPVYMYLFDWPTPALGGKLKAAHNIELPFVFDNLDKAEVFIGKGPQPLADKMSGAWTAFAHTGNPNHAGLPHWPAYDTSTRATMIFNDECKVVSDPGKDERLAMASLTAT